MELEGPGDAPGEYSESDAGVPPLPSVKALADVEAVGDVAGGLVAEGVGIGGVPELNSANRGHFRFVSGEKWVKPANQLLGIRRQENLYSLMCPICPQSPQRLCTNVQ